MTRIAAWTETIRSSDAIILPPMGLITKEERSDLSDRLFSLADNGMLDLQPFAGEGTPEFDCEPTIRGLKITERKGDVVTGYFDVTFLGQTREGCDKNVKRFNATGYFDFTADLISKKIETHPLHHRRSLDRKCPEF